jgi:ribosomal protein S18 acetylase RimI-like enzyme
MKEGLTRQTIQIGNETITFRYPRWRDVPAYVEMCRTLHRERVMAYHAETDFAKGCQRLSDFLVALETGTGAHVVAEAGDLLIGEGSIQTGSVPHLGVLGIKIIGAYRKRGLGTIMMQQLETEARTLDLNRIFLNAWGINTPAINLYKKVGYREVGRVADWFSDTDENGNQILADKVEMIKELEEEE